MERKIVWLMVSCFMVATLVLVSCGPAVTEEEEAVTPPPGEEEGAPPETAAEHCERGTALIEEENYEAAIPEFNKAIELDLSLAEAYYGRGFAYTERGEYDCALADLNEAIELNPGLIAAYNNRGFVYNQKGQYDLAIADLNKAIEFDPDWVKPHINRGWAYNQKGQYDLAIADLSKAIQLSPELTVAYYNRGFAYTEKGQDYLAFADLNKVVELSNNPTLIQLAQKKLRELEGKYLETENLRIYYPDFIDENAAKEHARILQEAYDFYYDLIGQEYPFKGRKIEIIFDSSLGNISYAGNPIRMGTDSGIFDGKILPPEPAFFHEMVHDFTTGDKTSVAKYVDINGAITEALADLFTNCFRQEKLKYSKGAAHWINMLKEYERKKTDPYSLDWGAHKDAQLYIFSILFYFSEEFGWDVWNRFFRVARDSNVDGIPLHKRGSFIDLRRSEDAIAFGNFVYILSIASGVNLIPTFENWGFQFENQTREKASNMYRDYVDYLSGLANQYYEDALNRRGTEEYAKALERLTLSMRIYENLGHMQEVEKIETLLEEIRSNNIIIDGAIDEWLSNAVMISDPSGDVSGDATSDKGADLKAVYAIMDEECLYIAIQVYGGFAPSLPRNYFIALDFNGDQRDEYHFGVRPSGSTWVFDHTIDTSNWNAESTVGVVAIGERYTIEIRIPREDYQIPRNILICCRVTEGGPTVDKTEWLRVP